MAMRVLSMATYCCFCGCRLPSVVRMKMRLATVKVRTMTTMMVTMAKNRYVICYWMPRRFV